MINFAFLILGIASCEIFHIVLAHISKYYDGQFANYVKKAVDSGLQSEVYYKGLPLNLLSKSDLYLVVGLLAREMYYYEVPRPIDIMIKPCRKWRVSKMLQGKKEAKHGTVHFEPISEAEFKALLEKQLAKYEVLNER
jgi:hypothetical protein